MPAVRVTLKEVVKIFTDRDAKDRTVLAVDRASFSAPEGRLTALLGPSGCGKTTVLRMVAGLETPTSGDIFFGERSVVNVSPQERDAALVFQTYALFPHMSVYENVAFGLKVRKVGARETKKQVAAMLDLVGLRGLENRLPGQLSGGQQQRVALARALVVEPSVLLFDEPLSNLDAKLREQMRVEIKKLVKRVGLTSLYVTHDREEAMAISDQVVVMNRGVVEQVGTPEETYRRPCTPFVANFVGKANLLPARIELQSRHWARASVMGRSLDVPAPPDLDRREEGLLLVRPEHLRLVEAAKGAWRGRVTARMYLGSFTAYEVTLAEAGSLGILHAQTSHPLFTEGDEVGLDFAPEDAWLLARAAT